MDIAQLVTLAQQGDEQAKSKLLRLAAEWVYARMFLSVRSSEAADDLAQDALVAALTGLPRLRNPRAFLPWLRRITENVLADYRRGRARTPGEVELDRIPSRGDADCSWGALMAV